MSPFAGPGAAGSAPPVLVAVAHGTRDPAGLRTVAQVLDRVRALRPGTPVVCGFVGPALPGLDEVLEHVTGPAVVVPLLLGPGYHVRTDIPAAVRRAGRRPLIRTAAPLGPDPLLAGALADRLREAGWAGRGAVVLAAAASREPGARTAVATAAAQLAGHLGRPVVPAFLGGSPSPAEAVAALRQQGHGPVAVAPYLLAPGDFARRAAAAAGPGNALVSAPLGAHEAVARLVLRRYDAARARTAGAVAAR
ncbi:hypothetical protein GCM10010218_07410 [Streptomyces mashuensis]|uniref:Sirohydrochlorin chelatase n=1 Tax=Streptomyces mashuensis TaxID=33904 RepID=A0A919AWD0_9ACTN|nr:CbiX/SirB N-terminal domain-containing protein [Streptomyces mashuensis]GHF28777.1 hypothetical protein GCM10010218_07410 [Streptomyces mashuensis]